MGLSHGSAARGLGWFGSSTKWVSEWVGDFELQWANDVEDRVRPTAARQGGESLRESFKGVESEFEGVECFVFRGLHG